MSKNVVRVGDPLSCGDFVATGSSDVFANGMPLVSGAAQTTGHWVGSDFYPPTVFIGPWSPTVFINNMPAVLTEFTKTEKEIHRHDRSKHDGVVISGSGNVGAADE